MRRTAVVRWGQAPNTYPYRKPFHRTPYDEDRHKMRRKSPYPTTEPRSPKWMYAGLDGTGRGIGLHRTHPLSSLTGNLQETQENIPRIFRAMMRGFSHTSGARLYYKGGKVPHPEMHPFLTGRPDPVHGWKILDHDVTRKFEAPIVDKERVVYKPYVALHEKKLYEDDDAQKKKDEAAALEAGGPGAKPPVADKPRKDKSDKPLLKRLFFWQ
jgi:hypothetical protein